MSGGVGAALLIVAVVGLVAATTDLASQINQEVNPGAEPFSLGSLIGDAIIQAMDDEGVDGTDRAAAAGLGAALGFLLMQPDLAGQMAEASALADGRSADFASGMRLGVMIAAVVFTVAMTIALTVASGGASSANLVSSTAKNAMKAATYLQATAAFTQGVASVGSGATQIAVAYDQRDADEARAAAKAIEAVLAELSAQSEEQIARLRDIIESLQEGMLMFRQMVDTAGDQQLLRLYFGEVTPSRWARLQLMKMMSEFREGMWAVVQQAISTLDTDFVSYADERLGNCERLAARPQFEQWLVDAAAPAL